jgi:hypothetical protein
MKIIEKIKSKIISGAKNVDVPEIKEKADFLKKQITNLTGEEVTHLMKSFTELRPKKLKNLFSGLFGFDSSVVNRFLQMMKVYLDTNKDEKLQIREVLSVRTLQIILIVIGTIIFNPLFDMIINEIALQWNVVEIDQNAFVIILKNAIVPFVLLYLWKRMIEKFNVSVKAFELQVDIREKDFRNEINQMGKDMEDLMRTSRFAADNQKTEIALLVANQKTKNREIELLNDSLRKTENANERLKNEIFRLKGIDPELLKSSTIDTLTKNLEIVKEELNLLKEVK